jgi:uncharacterized protein YndB with AHSA1/START domain
MARNELVVAAEPEAVWSVLADPPRYADWVVGSDAVESWDDAWPAPGSRFQHRAGRPPAAVEDHTEVLASAPPRRLVLRAKARPLGVARVELLLEPHPAGTLVTLRERPDAAAGRVLQAPLEPLLRLRNGESLRRLRVLAETRR